MARAARNRQCKCHQKCHRKMRARRSLECGFIAHICFDGRSKECSESAIATVIASRFHSLICESSPHQNRHGDPSRTDADQQAHSSHRLQCPEGKQPGTWDTVSRHILDYPFGADKVNVRRPRVSQGGEQPHNNVDSNIWPPKRSSRPCHFSYYVSCSWGLDWSICKGSGNCRGELELLHQIAFFVARVSLWR